MDGSPPRHRVASVRAVIATIVGPIVAAVPIGRIAVTVAVGRIVIAVGRPPQRRADQRADGEGAETPPPTTPAGLRRFRRAHGDCAGEQHGDQRSSHGLSSLVFHFVRAKPLLLYRGTLSGNDCVVGPSFWHRNEAMTVSSGHPSGIATRMSALEWITTS